MLIQIVKFISVAEKKLTNNCSKKMVIKEWLINSNGLNAQYKGVERSWKDG